MQLCLMIEGQEGVTWPQWLALAEACERHAIPALFRSDHYMNLDGQHPERGSLDAWGTICGLAAVTSELQLGTMVSPATFRHPSELARLVVTADQISGGRVALGLGAGWHEREHEAHGFEFPPVAHADRHPRGAAPDRARQLGRRAVLIRRRALHPARPGGPAEADSAPAPAADHGRQCRAAQRFAGRVATPTSTTARL